MKLDSLKAEAGELIMKPLDESDPKIKALLEEMRADLRKSLGPGSPIHNFFLAVRPLIEVELKEKEKREQTDKRSN